MSQRRQLLEKQYLFGLEKKNIQPKSTSHLLVKICNECGSENMASYSEDHGKTWFCYGHRPEATQEDREKQNAINFEVQQRIEKPPEQISPEIERKARFAPPRPTSDEEDYSRCFETN